MSGLQLVNDRLEGLVGSLSAPARKERARSIGRRLRASQQQNIKLQQAPDGTPSKPCKTQPMRSKKGRIKREMFAKLRTAKYLKTQASPNEAVIEFAGNVQRMARVHHYGLRDRTSRKGKEVQYEARPLLSITDAGFELIGQYISAQIR